MPATLAIDHPSVAAMARFAVAPVAISTTEMPTRDGPSGPPVIAISEVNPTAFVFFDPVGQTAQLVVGREAPPRQEGAHRRPEAREVQR